MFISSISQNVFDALTSMSLWSAIVKSLSIIIIGFLLRKFNILPQTTSKVVTKIVLAICLPCLAFDSFMADITKESFTSAIFSFVWGFIMYILLILLTKIVFIKYKGSRKEVFEILLVFGSTTFFGQPIIQTVFPNAFIDSNLFNIAFRVFLYSYVYIVISGIEFDKDHIKDSVKKIVLNPIVIATFIGFLLWGLQLILPDTTKISIGQESYQFYRIDKTLPIVSTVIETLGGMASPLVWIAIGATLGDVPFKKAAMDKEVWFYSLIKIFVVPLINLTLLLAVNLIIDVNLTTVIATTLMWAVPPSTIATSFCISYDKHADFASDCNLIGTLVAVVGIPFWIMILTIITQMAIF